MRKIYLSIILVWSSLGSWNSTMAQDEFEQVQVLDRPRYSLTRRADFVLDGSFLPLDGYYKPLMIEAGFNFQPFDWLSWEVGRFGWSFYNHNTGLGDSINNLLKSEGSTKTVSGLELKDTRFHASSTAFFNLLYSKSNFFNTRVVYYYWQIGSGVSYYDFQHGKTQTGLDLAMRIRFFINENYTFNVRGGHTLGFSSDVPNNITFLSLGVGFAF